MSSNRERRAPALIRAVRLALLALLAWPAVTLVASTRARAQPAPYDAPADNPAPLPPPAHLDANPAAAPDAPSPVASAPATPTARTTVEELEPSARARPRLSAAVGMGASFESAGLSPARTALVPAFFATGGMGVDWPVGVEASVFSSSSSGRFKSPDTPVDRLALGLIGVVRPCVWTCAPGDRYLTRVARAFGVELGLGVERDATTTKAGSRVAFQAGARVELPLFPTPATKELRVRLAARRMQGFYTPRVGTIDVGDSFEVYAALVSVF